jgi:hypothetical protein
MIAHKDIFTMEMGPVAHSANAIHTCSMFKTALTTSWAFKNSTLWRAWPIISAHLCNQAIIDCYKTTPKTNIIEICKGFRTEELQPDLAIPSAFASTHRAFVGHFLLESWNPPDVATQTQVITSSKRQKRNNKCCEQWKKKKMKTEVIQLHKMCGSDGPPDPGWLLAILSVIHTQMALFLQPVLMINVHKLQTHNLIHHTA